MLDKDAVTRRAFLAGSTAAVGFAGTSPAFADVAWKKFAGTTLEVNLAKGPRGDTLAAPCGGVHRAHRHQGRCPRVIPEQQQRQKAVIELTSGRRASTSIHLSYHVQKRQFEKAGWLADLTPLPEGPEPHRARPRRERLLAPAACSSPRTTRASCARCPGRSITSSSTGTRRLFQKKGVALPETLEDMASLAEKLTDPKEGIYGFVGRGLRNANMTLWTNFFLNYGGEFLDAKGNIQTDGPEAIEATKLYQRLLTKSAPPGVAGFNWMESMASFTQGRAAMWIDGVGLAPPLEDPNTSRVVGKVGYAVLPKGPKGAVLGDLRRRHRRCAASKNKEAAYLYCQWAVRKTMGARLLQAGGGVPFRNSILNDEDVRNGRQDAAGMAQSVDRIGEDLQARPAGDRPGDRVPRHLRRRRSPTLSGADPAAELKKATDQFQPILESSEKA